jgi:hypothetical protein
MSVFMMIKYPISMPPTREELGALPHVIFKQWMSEIIGDELSERLSTDTVADIMKKTGIEDIRDSVDRLRCIIYCLDEE